MPDLHENLQNIKKKLASIYTFDFIYSEPYLLGQCDFIVVINL